MVLCTAAAQARFLGQSWTWLLGTCPTLQSSRLISRWAVMQLHSMALSRKLHKQQQLQQQQQA
jgi:hypothetical protein